MKDVSASKGIIVAPAGFSEGAQAVAKANDIDLLSYREATDADWKKAVNVCLRIIQFRPDWVRVHFETDAGPIDVAEGVSVQIEGTPEPVLVQSVIRDLCNDWIAHKFIGEAFIERELPGFTLLPSGERLVSVKLEAFVRAFEYDVGPLGFGSGHILQDQQSSAEQILNLYSDSIDTEALFKTPGRELTAAELQADATGNTSMLSPATARHFRLAVSITSDQKK